MNWNDIFAFDDFPLTEVEQRRRLKELKLQVTSLRNSLGDGTRSRNDLRDELAAMEFNFARLLLLVQSLTTTLLRKDLITPDELKTVIAEIDLVDGEADNLLDPAAMPGMQAPSSERRSTEGALYEMQRNTTSSPRPTVHEFLKELEDQDE